MRRCIGAKISTICLDCEKGKASSSGSTECTHCPHGRTSPEGSGLEHISQIAKGEFTKDMEMLNHKIQSARLVFDWHWIVGCCIALFAAVSSNIGLNLQRLSHLENQFVDPFAKHKAGLQARSSATSRVKEETEESLRAELQMKENARKEIQEEMKKIINDSEQRANTKAKERASRNGSTVAIVIVFFLT